MTARTRLGPQGTSAPFEILRTLAEHSMTVPRLGELLARISTARPQAQASGWTVTLHSTMYLVLRQAELHPELSGECLFETEAPGSHGQRVSTMTVEARAGHIIAIDREASNAPSSRITGSLAAWLDAILRGETRGLDLSRSGPLGEALLEVLHEELGNHTRKTNKTRRAAK